MVEVVEAAVEENQGVRVEILPRLAGAVGRKLYVVATGSLLRIPEGRAHAHGNPDHLIPITGNIVLAYQTADGRVLRLTLQPGREYIVPPNVPHQVEIRGGILESLFPTAVFEKRIPIRELPGGFFVEEVPA